MSRIFIIVLVVFIFGCKGKKDAEDAKSGADSLHIDTSELPDSLPVTSDNNAPFLITEANKDSVLTSMTRDVLTLIKNKKYSDLDSFIHPESGVRFSPYATVDVATDRQFSKEAFAALFTTQKNKKYNWGNYDGSGEPIVLTPKDYFARFVYDADFAHSQKMSINKIFKRGNAINNIETVYKDGAYTESHFSGSKKADRLDWKSVRLVFELHNGRYYLVGVVHDGWTI